MSDTCGIVLRATWPLPLPQIQTIVNKTALKLWRKSHGQGLVSINSKLSSISSPGNGHLSPRASTNSLFQNLQAKRRRGRQQGKWGDGDAWRQWPTVSQYQWRGFKNTTMLVAGKGGLAVVVVVVVLTLTHRYNAVRGHRTGSNKSGAEEYFRGKCIY